MSLLPSLNLDFLKTFLWDVAKDLLNETAFEHLGNMYSSICVKFAREYLDGCGTPPKFLRRYRKRFYRIARLSVLVIDEIDRYLGKSEQNLSKFEELCEIRSKDASSTIEIKATARRRKTKNFGDSTEDD